MSTSKNQRRLLIISELQTSGRTDLKWLYQFLDASGPTLGLNYLQGMYKEVTVLTGKKATKSNFINTLCSLSEKPGTKAVDVILQLHGGENELTFYDGDKGDKVKTNELAMQIKSKQLNNKLRLLYSMACHGYKHTDDFIDAGFRTVSGACGVNANSATDYPAQLAAWASGKQYTDCVTLGNAEPGRSIADNIAKTMGFSKANSFKKIRGYKKLTINSNA